MIPEPEPFTAPCPYFFCDARVQFTVEYVQHPDGQASALPARRIIRAHDIVHPILRTTCPASNMRYPFDGHVITMLERQARLDSRTIQTALADEERDQANRPQRDGPGQSTNHRGLTPHRMGREPELDSPDWHLGGREDEEIIPENTNPPVIPSHVYGKRLGTMTTINEVQAILNEANVNVGEAMGAANQAHDSLTAAREAITHAAGLIGGLLGSSSGSTLSDSLAGLQGAADSMSHALSTIADAQGALASAEENNTTYSAMLNG